MLNKNTGLQYTNPKIASYWKTNKIKFVCINQDTTQINEKQYAGNNTRIKKTK